MDEVDQASAMQEAVLGAAIQAARSAAGTVSGATECEDCGEEIPETRRFACPWATRCVNCQREIEALQLRKGVSR